MPKTQIYGMPRTGTNYLSKVLEMNFPDLEVRQHGKHAPHDQTVDVDGFIIPYKNPWSWLVSFRRFFHTGVFDRLEWAVRDLRKVGWKPYQCARWWMNYLHAYLGWERDLENESVVWIEYRSLLEGLDIQLTRIEQTQGWVRTEETRNVGQRVDSNTESEERSFDSTYYIDHEYMDEFSTEDISQILEAAENLGLPERFEQAPFQITPPGAKA